MDFDKEKLEQEIAKIKEVGLEEYLKSRKVKTNLVGLLVAVAIGFALGAFLL